jgi:hypothetical protein
VNSYAVHPADDESEVSDVVEEQHHGPDEPHVGEVGEEDEEGAQSVVQGVLVVVALGADEGVAEEPAEVLAELQEVEALEFETGLVEIGIIVDEAESAATAAQPPGHEAALPQQEISPDGAGQVVEFGEGPLGEGVASLLAPLHVGVLGLVDVVHQEPIVEVVRGVVEQGENHHYRQPVLYQVEDRPFSDVLEFGEGLKIIYFLHNCRGNDDDGQVQDPPIVLVDLSDLKMLKKKQSLSLCFKTLTFLVATAFSDYLRLVCGLVLSY